MTTSAAEIETIIRVVIERLRAVQPAQVLEQSSHQTQLVSAKAVPADAATLRLDGRLITLEQLKNKLNGIRRLEVLPRAIVTPAVLDELRDRGVRLHRVSGSASGTSPVERAEAILLAAPAAKADAIGKQAPADRLVALAVDGPPEITVRELGQRLASANRRGIWCSRKPFAAMVSTASHAHITAVQLSNLNDLPRALDEAKPNLLILDDSQWSLAAVINLASAWHRSRP